MDALRRLQIAANANAETLLFQRIFIIVWQRQTIQHLRRQARLGRDVCKSLRTEAIEPVEMLRRRKEESVLTPLITWEGFKT